jgi:hypothetical protein
MKNKIFKATLSLLTVAIFVILLKSSTFAQDAINMVVGPARQEVTLDPGKTQNIEVRFYNQNNYPLTGIVNVADFTVTGNEGSPRIIDNPSAASPKYSGASWLSIPYNQMTIAPSDKVSVPVTITVPENAAPGGRYVAVYFQPGGQAPSAAQGSGSGVAPRVASLIYIKISGDIKENAVITRFNVADFFEYGPVKVETEILNRGDYHIRPRGIVTLSDMFGGVVDQVSISERNIFPDASLVYSNEIGEKWLFGKYKVTFSGTYGGGKVLETSTYVWVLPLRIITVIVLAITILWLIIRKLVNSSKKQFTVLEDKLSQEEEEIQKLKEMLKGKKKQ